MVTSGEKEPQKYSRLAFTPGNPADAFEAFVEMVRRSSSLFDAAPEEVFRLLVPFIVNPARNEGAVHAIVEAYGAAATADAFKPFLRVARFMPWVMPAKATMEQHNPSLIERLQALESMLKTELRPGSIVLRIMPIRYLETPEGYGEAGFHRYKVTLQTLVEPSPDDTLDAVSIHFTAEAEGAEIVIDSISPQPGFSTIGVKTTRGAQVGIQETAGEKYGVGGELSGGGAKLSSSIETSHSRQESMQISAGTEQNLVRPEQYLIARKVGNVALWRILAGVGPVDAGGLEYVAELLVPKSIQEIQARVEAKVEWTRAGTVPDELRQVLRLPPPNQQR